MDSRSLIINLDNSTKDIFIRFSILTPLSEYGRIKVFLATLVLAF